MEIYKKIPLIMGEVGAIGRDNTVQSGPARFNFRSIDQVYNALNKIMAKHGVFSTSKILSKDVKSITSKQGTGGTHATIDYEFTFYASDGSHVETQVTGEGIDYGDKAHNKCEAIAHKYALTQIFVIPYDDMIDPDSQTHEVEPMRSAKKPSSKNQYIIPFGKFKGMTFEKVPKWDLEAYITYIETSACDSGKELTGDVLDFVNRACEFLGGRK